jgi:hypothetical protein
MQPQPRRALIVGIAIGIGLCLLCVVAPVALALAGGFAAGFTDAIATGVAR